MKHRPTGGVVSALAVTAMTASLAVAAAPTAVAAVDVRCAPTARVFTVQSDGDLWLYEHGTPESGGFDWPSAAQIGWGWAGRTLAGPDGVVYNITDTGEARRFRWNGSGWDTFGTRQYEVVSAGKWNLDGAARNTVTVDSRGDFYKIEHGSLFHGDVRGTTVEWRYLGSGFAHDYLVASGPGVLYARSSANGDLHRLRYHEDSHRLYRAMQPVGREWGNVWKIIGAGGGVLYGTQHDGDLYWNRDNAGDDQESSWAVGGSVVGYDWGNDRDTVADPAACARVPEAGPARPAVADVPEAASAVAEVDGSLRTFHVNASRTITKGVQNADGTWTFRESVMDTPRAVTPVSFVPHDERPLLVSHGTDGGVSQALVDGVDGPWVAKPGLAGHAPTSPAVVQSADGTVSAYLTDENGALWRRAGRHEHTDPLGDRPWTQLIPDMAYTGRPAALPLANGSVVVAGTLADGALRLVWERDGKPTMLYRVLGRHLTGTPTLVRHGDNGFRVFAKSAHGGIHTLLFQNNEHGDWTDLADWTQGQGTSGVVAAVTGPDGRVEIAYRAWRDQGVYVAAQETPGGPFGPATRVGDVAAGSDPTLVVRSSGERALVFRDGAGATHVLHSGPTGYTGGAVS
ncbi:tachylectin-related carbohydrate-binding protein [Saccharothrix hoggarensis]|uniref:Tachylectin-related carbohydrate-binding protein n=1 Tax=Saccharothrix hoggarensis TaxID=913853 RepID=A0ABW3QRD9_9PSEU